MNRSGFISLKKRFASIAARSTPAIFQLFGDAIAIGLALPVFIQLGFFTGFYSISFPLYDESILNSIFLSILPATILYWICMFWLAGLYRNWFVRSPFTEVFTVIRAIALGSLFVFLAILFTSANFHGFRLKIILYAIILCILVSISRIIIRVFQRALRRKGIIKVETILMGNPDKIADLYITMTQNPSWGYRAQGVILSHETDLINWQKRIVPSTTLPILGYSNQAQQILSKESPSDVIVMMEQTDHRWLLDIVMQCRELGISVKIQPDLYEIFTGQARLLAIHGMPLIDINPELLKTWERVVKRIFDIAFSAIVLLLGLPFLLITAILVKLDSKGPIFFSQIRVGKNGQIFTMYKFRSMITDAEAEGPRWASVNDPRVTRLGRFLRKSHLDEIPQFWNVLKGEMSLVGPRPERPFFVEKFKKDVPYYLRRLVIRPGLTGWNQVHYRDYEETLEEITNRLKHDFYYIENMSLQLDVEIIIRTVIRVFRGQGQA